MFLHIVACVEIDFDAFWEMSSFSMASMAYNAIRWHSVAFGDDSLRTALRMVSSVTIALRLWDSLSIIIRTSVTLTNRGLIDKVVYIETCQKEKSSTTN